MMFHSSYDSNDDSGKRESHSLCYSWDDVKRESALAARIARGVYQHPTVVSSFGCKAWSSVTHNYGRRMKTLGLLLREILEQVVPLPAEKEDTLLTKTEAEEPSTEGDEDHEATQLAKKLQRYLKGKRFLIVLEDVECGRQLWDAISSALLHVDDDCPPGSAIIITTSYREVAESSSPRKIFEAQSLYAAFCNKAKELIGGSEYCSMKDIESILQYCHPDAFAMKMVLHLLYVNPNKTEDELMKISESLSECERLNKSIAKQMLMFCYKELPSKYWSCLMYLSIFPKHHIIRRTSLARRWIAEGLITANLGTAMDRSMHQASATDEAERCFKALVTRGFVLPWEISTACNIKSIRVHDEVRKFITGIAADVSFVDTNLPPHLAHHLSIHSRIGLRETHSNHLVETDGDGNCIAAYLPYLAKSSQWQLLKVLDLEGCKGLKKKHLKNICKILLLKYLSLRNTDVTEIPKQFEKLQCLETLDIRQTALQALATKSFMLPMLKYLLAGQADSSSNSSVCLPSGIRRMKNLEIMSHVEVSDNVDDLTDVGQLLQLRKLGVILHAKNGALGLLFQQIEKLYDCLRSLSIRINQPVRSEGTDAEEVVALVSPPKLLLENLNISGITSGLPLWIAELNQLVKITLSKTDLEEDALGIIGNLRTLSCLRLRHKSYTRRELNFKKKEFKGLKSLVIEGSDITIITFDAGAAPKLEMIVWTFAKMEAISGVIHLPRLKKLELNGDCNPSPVRQAIKDHPNHPVFKHNPYHQGQEAETVIAASTP